MFRRSFQDCMEITSVYAFATVCVVDLLDCCIAAIVRGDAVSDPFISTRRYRFFLPIPSRLFCFSVSCVKSEEKNRRRTTAI